MEKGEGPIDPYLSYLRISFSTL